MRRRLFTALSILPLVFCLGVVALWVRSFTTLERLAVSRTDLPAMVVRGSIITSNRGLVSVNLTRDAYQSRGEFDNRRRKMSKSGIEYQAKGPRLWEVGIHWWNWLGFGYFRFTPSSDRLISFPHWFVLLLGLPLPAWWVWSRVRLAPRRRGTNLTGNTSGVCPECGTVISTSL